MSSKHWMYAGFGAIVVSNGLQVAGTLSPALPYLSVAGLAVSTGSIIFTIFQAQKSAVENQQELDRMRQEREEGDKIARMLANPAQEYIWETKRLYDEQQKKQKG